MRRAPYRVKSLLRIALALGVVAMLLTLWKTAPMVSASGPTLTVMGYAAPGNLLTVAGVGFPLRDTVSRDSVVVSCLVILHWVGWLAFGRAAG
jgi:hypothetical protein